MGRRGCTEQQVCEGMVTIDSGLPLLAESNWHLEESQPRVTDRALESISDLPFSLRLPSCVLRRSWRPSPWQERGPRLLLQVVRLLLLPAPSGAGGLSQEVLPVRWDMEWHPAQLHRWEMVWERVGKLVGILPSFLKLLKVKLKIPRVSVLPGIT